jgi:hypothetical protein
MWAELIVVTLLGGGVGYSLRRWWRESHPYSWQRNRMVRARMRAYREGRGR